VIDSTPCRGRSQVEAHLAKESQDLMLSIRPREKYSTSLPEALLFEESMSRGRPDKDAE
jgi:hypothetical protein